MRSFKPKIVSWGNVQNKPEIDVDEESFLFVDKDVSIMAILDLEDIGNNRIGSLRPDEILPCLLEPEAVFRTEIAQKELVQRLFIRLSYRVSRDAVWHNFDDASNIQGSPCSIGKCMIREKVEAEVVSFENLQEELDDLKG